MCRGETMQIDIIQGAKSFVFFSGVKKGWGADYMRTFLSMRNMADE
jgi:hypothetical protein